MGSRLVVSAVALVGVLAMGLGASSAQAAPVHAPHRVQVTASTVSLAVAGDSTSAMPNSWMYLLTSPITLRGGYVHSGYTSAQVLSHIAANTHPDVLVVKLGVNDIRTGVTSRTTLVNIKAIFAKVGAHRNIVSAIVPCGITDDPTTGYDRQALGAALNTRIRAAAVTYGWEFVDADADIRTASNGYVGGHTIDGVHPDDYGFGVEAAVMQPMIVGAL